MTAVELLLVAAAGATGALLRHELTTGRPLRALHTVNVAGSFGLGLVLALATVGGPVALAAGAGFGGLTSFSSWVVGARDVARGTSRPTRVSWGHLVVPAVLAVVGATAGVLVGSALGGTDPGGLA